MTQKKIPTLLPQTLKLAEFLPYQLSILNATVSDVVAQVYQGRFNLSPQEWKVMAALGEHEQMTAKEITQFSHMDKMQVSRAIAQLRKTGLVRLQSSQRDKRMTWVSLNTSGRAIYDVIAPLVLEKEQQLLAVLSQEERAVMNRCLEKMLQQSHEISDLT